MNSKLLPMIAIFVTIGIVFVAPTIMSAFANPNQQTVCTKNGQTTVGECHGNTAKNGKTESTCNKRAASGSAAGCPQ